jgi:hypothetical protein
MKTLILIAAVAATGCDQVTAGLAQNSEPCIDGKNLSQDYANLMQEALILNEMEIYIRTEKLKATLDRLLINACGIPGAKVNSASM